MPRLHSRCASRRLVMRMTLRLAAENAEAPCPLRIHRSTGEFVLAAIPLPPPIASLSAPAPLWRPSAPRPTSGALEHRQTHGRASKKPTRGLENSQTGYSAATPEIV